MNETELKAELFNDLIHLQDLKCDLRDIEEKSECFSNVTSPKYELIKTKSLPGDPTALIAFRKQGIKKQVNEISKDFSLTLQRIEGILKVIPDQRIVTIIRERYYKEHSWKYISTTIFSYKTRNASYSILSRYFNNGERGRVPEMIATGLII